MIAQELCALDFISVPGLTNKIPDRVVMMG